MNMKAISESTTFTIQVKFHFNSTKTKIIKAGNRGLIEY